MNEVEYVRVRDGYPVVRFEAETAERYEESQRMALKNFSFEQFESRGEEVTAVGGAGIAEIQLESGNIHMTDGVRIDVDSEDISIATAILDWQDDERLLSGGENAEVDIQRSDGTSFSGWGFSANARKRTWTFMSGVAGTYIHTDDEDEDDTEADEETTETEDTAALPAKTGAEL
jgi:LPS export ABC transporter protein LptC